MGEQLCPVLELLVVHSLDHRPALLCIEQHAVLYEVVNLQAPSIDIYEPNCKAELRGWPTGDR